MRAARMHGYTQPLIPEDVPVPDVTAAGMCRTGGQPVDGYVRKDAEMAFPVTPGHEINGEVQKVGSLVPKAAGLQVLAFLLVVAGSPGLSPAAQKEQRGDPKAVKPALVLHYTFAGRAKDTVKDQAQTRHEGRIVKGKVVKTDDGPALDLGGEGHVAVTRSPALNPAGAPLVVGAWVYPGAARGVVAALGGEDHGFSLYLKDGVPTFALRVDGRLVLAQASRRIPSGRWTHLMGVLDADGRARVWVDGRPAGDPVNAGHIARNPEDGMTVGADTGSQVGDYRDHGHFTGRLRDLRLYRGVPAETELKKWAKAE